MSEDRSPEAAGADPVLPAPPPAPAAATPATPGSAMPPLWSRMGAGLNPAMIVALVALLLSAWQWTTSQRDSARLQTELAKRLAGAEAAAVSYTHLTLPTKA